MKRTLPRVEPSGSTAGVQRPSVPVKNTQPDISRTGSRRRFIDAETFVTAVIRLARRGGLRHRLRAVAGVGITVALVLLGGVGGMPTATAAASPQPPVGLGTAASFAVLAGQTVTNTGSTIISGNVGVSPGTAVTGFPPGTVIDGQVYTAGSITNLAQVDLTTAYNDAAGRIPATVVGALSGQTLAPGVYKTTTGMSLTGTVTLDAYGNPNAVFIFQAGSTLITASHSTVLLSGGAQACNVFWQVGSSATLGTNTTFVGTILALTSATVNTGATVVGRVLARNGQVSMDSNTITVPTCNGSTTPSSTTIATAPSRHAITLGQSVHDVATVAGNATDGTPTGSVQFYVCGAGSTACTPSSGTALTPVEPLSGGVATSPPFTPSASGTYCFAAVYAPSGSTYAASSETGTPTNGECVTVTTAATTPHHTTPSAVVPSTHTGKPWSGWLYWLLVAATGAAGIVLVTDRASRRHASRRLGR